METIPCWVWVAVGIGAVFVVRELYAKATEKSVAGKRVLITGAGSGIGRLLALRFAREGGALFLWDLNEAGLEETKRQALDAGAKSVAIDTVDVSNASRVREAAESVGDIDILINNAGIVSGQRILDIPEERIVKTFEVNTLAHFWTVRAFLQGMLDRNDGHIVTMASASGYSGISRMTDYASSKWAAIGFDESLRRELRHMGKSGIHTTCVNCFYINTGMFDGVSTRFPLILPILEPQYVVDRMMTAIRRNQAVLDLPAIVSTTPLMRGLLPTAWLDWTGDFLGLNSSMDHFKGRAAAAASSAPASTEAATAAAADRSSESASLRRRKSGRNF